MIRSSLTALAACLALFPQFAAAQVPAETFTLYKGATLIDGTGSPPRAGMSILVKGERIERVWKEGEIAFKLAPHTQVVDVAGQYVLPGLIDSHEHLATPPNRPYAQAHLRRDLYSGVTAIRDMADDLRNVADLARATRIGEIPGPDIYYAALMAGPSFFVDPRTQAIAHGAVAGQVPWEQAIDGKTDMPLAVARAKGTFATAVKIYANLPGDLVLKITGEAHRQGMQVWAHGMVFPATPFEVLDAGVDVVSHSCYLAYQAMERRPDSYQHRFPIDAALFQHDNPVTAKLFADMAKRGTILDATVHVYREVEAAAKAQGKPPLCTVALAGKLTNQAYRSGVTISAGTDADTPLDDPLPALFDELELLHYVAGLPSMAVVRAATLHGAKAAGLEKEMGTIEAGKLANFAVLAKNPLEDVRNFRSVVLTVKRGRAFPREDYRR